MSLQEQINHLKGLSLIKKIFNRHKIPFWLDAGALLCAYRDGDLTYEHDVDVGLYAEDMRRILGLKDEFNAEIKGCFSSFIPYYQTFYFSKKPYAHCDGIYWYRIGDIYTCHGVYLPFSLPQGLLQDFSEISFYRLSDEKFPAPKYVRKYLSAYYGKTDWKKHITCAEYAEYQKLVLNGERKPHIINKVNPLAVDFWKEARKADYRKYLKIGGVFV